MYQGSPSTPDILGANRPSPGVVEVSLREPISAEDFNAVQAHYEGLTTIRVFGHAPGTTPGVDPPTTQLNWSVYDGERVLGYLTRDSRVKRPPYRFERRSRRAAQ